MKKEVKFYWRNKVAVWYVCGKTLEELTNKCHELCERYHAIHFEIL